LPDLSDALRDADPATKRQVFDASTSASSTDKVEGRVQLSCTVADLLRGADLSVAQELIAGAYSAVRGDGHPTRPHRSTGHRLLAGDYALAA
jgi:hypothetical protein